MSEIDGEEAGGSGSLDPAMQLILAVPPDSVNMMAPGESLHPRVA